MKIRDAKLVALILGGETAHFNTLVERYKDAVFGVALSMMKNRDDALDIAQESFIRAYQKLDQISNPDRFGGWLMRITRNLCLNRLKRSKNYEQLSPSQALYELLTYGAEATYLNPISCPILLYSSN
ncbi:MAG: sigma-70 family RNA polymerase sigma factor [Candidatus Stahlbacteria bacterium]|nr:sigma-70 family RNA polymerase sigma factor [Candidatus Stahlbacteria bacterium]